VDLLRRGCLLFSQRFRTGLLVHTACHELGQELGGVGASKLGVTPSPVTQDVGGSEADGLEVVVL
jgi:hypothetical protein